MLKGLAILGRLADEVIYPLVKLHVGKALVCGTALAALMENRYDSFVSAAIGALEVYKIVLALAATYKIAARNSASLIMIPISVLAAARHKFKSICRDFSVNGVAVIAAVTELHVGAVRNVHIQVCVIKCTAVRGIPRNAIHKSSQSIRIGKCKEIDILSLVVRRLTTDSRSINRAACNFYVRAIGIIVATANACCTDFASSVISDSFYRTAGDGNVFYGSGITRADTGSINSADCRDSTAGDADVFSCTAAVTTANTRTVCTLCRDSTAGYGDAISTSITSSTNACTAICTFCRDITAGYGEKTSIAAKTAADTCFRSVGLDRTSGDSNVIGMTFRCWIIELSSTNTCFAASCFNITRIDVNVAGTTTITGTYAGSTTTTVCVNRRTVNINVSCGFTISTPDTCTIATARCVKRTLALDFQCTYI